MKKILCVLLVVAVAITCCGVLLTACNETSTDYSHTIVFYSSQGDSLQSATQVAINNFEAKFPGWKVQHVQVGGYDDVKEKVISEQTEELLKKAIVEFKKGMVGSYGINA